MTWKEHPSFFGNPPPPPANWPVVGRWGQHGVGAPTSTGGGGVWHPYMLKHWSGPTALTATWQGFVCLFVFTPDTISPFKLTPRASFSCSGDKDKYNTFSNKYKSSPREAVLIKSMLVGKSYYLLSHITGSVMNPQSHTYPISRECRFMCGLWISATLIQWSWNWQSLPS